MEIFLYSPNLSLDNNLLPDFFHSLSLARAANLLLTCLQHLLKHRGDKLSAIW